MLELVFKRPEGKKDFIGNGIVFFGKLANGSAEFCHIGNKFGRLIYEALVLGTVCRLYGKAYNDMPHEVIQVSKAHFDARSERQATDYLESLIGQFSGVYGLGKIPLLAFDSVASFIARKRVYFFTKTFGVTSFNYCASLTGYILYKFGTTEEIRSAFKNWRVLSPQDIYVIIQKFSATVK